MKFEILEHKADLKIRAFGKNKEELFLNMMLGMEDFLKPEIAEIKREIKIKSPDSGALLVDFLSEVLYQTQVNKEIYDKVEFKKFSDPSMGSGQVTEIEAELIGQKVERFGEEIKAATHHDLEIKQNENGEWEAIVLFDI